jgi:hypothetical protein
MNAVMRPVESQHIDGDVIAKLVTTGDLSQLNSAQQVAYYRYRCQQVGLDPAAKPFDLLKLQGRMTLYANAGCTQQLCALHKLSVAITSRDKVDDIYVVCARVTGPDGRSTENTGAVSIGGLKGEALANALLKTVTKATRRTVLAHVGLGMMDETEVETIPGAQKIAEPAAGDPRGDLSGVDNSMRDKHVSTIADILNADVEEGAKAQMLRDYVAEFLQQFHELYIAVADELAAQKIVTKAQLRAWLKVGIDRK